MEKKRAIVKIKKSTPGRTASYTPAHSIRNLSVPPRVDFSKGAVIITIEVYFVKHMSKVAIG